MQNITPTDWTLIVANIVLIVGGLNWLVAAGRSSAPIKDGITQIGFRGQKLVYVIVGVAAITAAVALVLKYLVNPK